jgi:two-component system, OmpR family, sensor histidine kinase QseC
VKAPMSLQRRLLLYLLISAPLVWAVALLVSGHRARLEVNELFDTELIRLARQTQATLGRGGGDGAEPAPYQPGSGQSGEADVRDLALAVWAPDGRLLLSDREGVLLPRRPSASGFVDDQLDGEPWRVYYLQSFQGESLVAVGQKVEEREELVYNLIGSQLLPWLLMLPVLLGAMAWAVRRALAPVHHLAAEVQARSADDLQPVAPAQVPAELAPLVAAMNGLFGRIEDTLERERRFTADAAHELRTPLAALRAQWDVLGRSEDGPARTQAASRVGAGLDRMERLVTQMLALTRVESASQLPRQAEVHWPEVVEEVFSDCLPLAERRRIELGCEWPASGAPPLPLRGDPALLTLLLRNLVDNAVRYAPEGSAVLLGFETDRLWVANDGPPLSAPERARLGERFHRPDGNAEGGSGLGVSIVQRIATLHGLAVAFGPRADGQGVQAVLSRAPGGSAP